MFQNCDQAVIHPLIKLSEVKVAGLKKQLFEGIFWPDMFLELAHYVTAQREKSMTEEEQNGNVI